MFSTSIQFLPVVTPQVCPHNATLFACKYTIVHLLLVVFLSSHP